VVASESWERARCRGRKGHNASASEDSLLPVHDHEFTSISYNHRREEATLILFQFSAFFPTDEYLRRSNTSDSKQYHHHKEYGLNFLLPSSTMSPEQAKHSLPNRFLLNTMHVLRNQSITTG
jgi:hypothetical protein